MTILSIDVVREKRNLEYVLNSCKETFKPFLNPKIYPKYCVELLAEKLQLEQRAYSFEIEYTTPKEWKILLHKS